MRGRLSNKWGKAYDHIMQSSTPIQDIQTREKQLIRILWALSLQIWNNRNKDLHGNDAEDALELCTTTLHEQVEILYASFSTDPHIVSSND